MFRYNSWVPPPSPVPMTTILSEFFSGDVAGLRVEIAELNVALLNPGGLLVTSGGPNNDLHPQTPKERF